MSTAIDGIVSGIDTSGLINAVIEAESGTLYAMQDTQNELSVKRERIAKLASYLTDVSSSIDDFDDLEDWSLAKVTSEDAVSFSATVADDATIGTYTVKVNRLARAEVQASQGYAERAADNTVATGSLDVTVGGVTTTVTIEDAADSLGDLAAKLDEVEGITAYTVNTGDASTPWKLVVQSDATGLANDFSIDTTNLTGTGGGGTVPTFTTVSPADDAEVEINGVVIESVSNVLNDVVPGIDLSLRTEGGPAEIVTIEQDDGALIDRVEAFVTAFNEASTYQAQQSFFNVDTGGRGPLAGDSTARRAVERIGLLVSNSYTITDNPLEGLSQLGFSTNRDGTLAFDRDAFKDAFNTDRDGVVEFLTSSDGPFAALKSEIDDYQVDSDEGALTNRQESLNESIKSYDERIADFQDYLDGYAQRLRDQFTAMEVSLGRLQSAQGQLASLFASTGSAG